MSSLAPGANAGAAMAETKVSLQGLKCPLPVLKTRKLLEVMAAGDVLVIECTDPLTAIDIPNLLRETGDALEQRGRKGKVLIFRIRKSDPGPSIRSHRTKRVRKSD
jgi:tRNA 2-thiouridine synthesizing protein A